MIKESLEVFLWSLGMTGVGLLAVSWHSSQVQFLDTVYSDASPKYCIFNNRHISLKGTLMKFWKSTNIFVFIWKRYVEDFTFKYLLLFEICAREICAKFVYKHSETIEYVKN